MSPLTSVGLRAAELIHECSNVLHRIEGRPEAPSAFDGQQPTLGMSMLLIVIAGLAIPVTLLVLRLEMAAYRLRQFS